MGIKSLICPLEGNANEIERALNEISEFSKYENLSKDQTDKLRLVGEELLGMVKGVFDIEMGRFWIEKDERGYIARLAASASVGERARSILDSTAKNTEYKGLIGMFNKVTDAVSKMFEIAGASPDMMTAEMPMSGVEVIEPDVYEWSLSKYEEECKRDEKALAWDEMELAVLKKMSKDIIISYRNDRIDISVVADI